jgi:hypothetical protein
MPKRMLRSVLVAAFAAIVAFGSLSGLAGAKGGVQADSAWSVAAPDGAVSDSVIAAPDDSAWS